MQNLTSQAPQGQAETPECSFLPFGTAVEYIGNLLAEIRSAKVEGKATITLTNSEIQSLAQANHSLRAARRSLTTNSALVAAAKAALAYDTAIASCANDPEKMASFCTAQGDDLDSLYADWIDKARAALAKADGRA